MLPTHGDFLAPPRPDRAEPPVSALAALDDMAFIGPELPRLPDLPQLPERPGFPALPLLAPLAPAPPASGSAPRPVPNAGTGFVEPKGCLYALSQPPLMLFLCVIGGLLGAGGAWDLLFL